MLELDKIINLKYQDWVECWNPFSLTSNPFNISLNHRNL